MCHFHIVVNDNQNHIIDAGSVLTQQQADDEVHSDLLPQFFRLKQRLHFTV